MLAARMRQCRHLRASSGLLAKRRPRRLFRAELAVRLAERKQRMLLLPATSRTWHCPSSCERCNEDKIRRQTEYKLVRLPCCQCMLVAFRVLTTCIHQRLRSTSANLNRARNAWMLTEMHNNT